MTSAHARVTGREKARQDETGGLSKGSNDEVYPQMLLDAATAVNESAQPVAWFVTALAPRSSQDSPKRLLSPIILHSPYPGGLGVG